MRAAVLGFLAACGRFGFQPGTPPADTNHDSPADADTSGLVAEWSMESVSGEVVADASGHGRDATCSVVDATCPVVVAGKHGNALRFDGVNDHLAVASSPDFETITGFTVTAWLWIDASPNSMYYCFANKGLGTQTNDTWQTCVTTSRAIFFGTGTDAVAGDSMYSNSSSVPLATWQRSCSATISTTAPPSPRSPESSTKFASTTGPSRTARSRYSRSSQL